MKVTQSFMVLLIFLDIWVSFPGGQDEDGGVGSLFFFLGSPEG